MITVLLGILGFPVLAVFSALLLISIWTLRGTGNAVVLTQFTIQDRPEIYEKLLIRGRVGGIMGWLLSTVGMHAEASLRATGNEITIDRTGLSGFTTLSVPFHETASAACHYYRAIGFLILALTVPAFNLMAFFYRALIALESGWAFQRACGDWWPLLLSAGAFTLLFYFIYALSKRIVIRVETVGGNLYGFAFKRGMGGGATVDLGKTLEAVDTLNRLIYSRGQKEVGSVSAI